MKRMLISLSFLLLASSSIAADQKWWSQSPWKDPNRDFLFYPDPRASEPEVELKKRKPEPPAIYEMNDIDQISAELKRIRGEAIINPTEANIYAYLKAQDWWFDKSAKFADMARRVVWAYPEVDYNVRNPVATFARSQNATRTAVERKELLNRLSADHGILFFARSDCKFCHDQAPILKAFERETGIHVMAITLDGKPIPMFPDAKPDNGISVMVTRGEGVQFTPALYLVNRKTQSAIPLGAGVVAMDDIAERIRVLASTEPGQEF